MYQTCRRSAAGTITKRGSAACIGSSSEEIDKDRCQRGQAAAAAAITARVAGLYGISFDPSKNDKVSDPAPNRPEPKQINFRELNEIFGRLPVRPQAPEHVGDALHPQAVIGTAWLAHLAVIVPDGR